LYSWPGCFLGLFVAGWCGCWYGCADCLVECCDVLYVHYVLALLLYHRAGMRMCQRYWLTCWVFLTSAVDVASLINLKMAISAETC